MSHVVTVRTQVRDAVALAAACRRLGLSQPVQGTATLFSSQATGQIVQLPGWTYPVVFDAASGEAHYDTFNGTWGDHKELGKLLQRYAAEKTCQEARRAGHQVFEQSLPDGSIRLTIQTGGVSAGGGAA
jgi:hypothetical protein